MHGDRDTRRSSRLGLLIDVLRLGAEQKLAEYLEAERAEYLARFGDQRDEHGKRLVVANGYEKPRMLETDLGPVIVRRPRVKDRRPDGRRFESQLLPPGLRKLSRKDIEPAPKAGTD